jgi:ketosteroid isomerase-like protein
MTQSTSNLPVQLASESAQRNKEVVENMFQLLEEQKFDAVKQLFAPAARKLMPYAPAGVEAVVEGREAIYEQFKDLPARFTRISYPRHIYTTNDPGLIFARFTGDFDVKGGGKYENDYVGTFWLEDEKIVEYREFFNPFLMAKAYGIKL